MSHFQRRRRQFGEPCDCLKPLIRIFGIITAFGKLNTYCSKNIIEIHKTIIKHDSDVNDNLICLKSFE